MCVLQGVKQLTVEKNSTVSVSRNPSASSASSSGPAPVGLSTQALHSPVRCICCVRTSSPCDAHSCWTALANASPSTLRGLPRGVFTCGRLMA